jgi:FMN-dependent NADH-azoreductase
LINSGGLLDFFDILVRTKERIKMKLLHIVATPRGHSSNTIRVSNVLLEELYAIHDDLEVTLLDLFREDLPAVAGENIESKYMLMTGQQLDDSHKNSWKQIEKNIENFLDADIYLITSPMWNFGIPYALKYYIDAIVQPGYLFQYNEQGYPEGMVHNRKMICVTSRGGDYSEGSPINSLDFVEPYLRSIFNFVGITDISFINIQPTDITPELRKDAIQNGIEEARKLVSDNKWTTPEEQEAVEFPDGVKPKPLGD